MRSSACEIHAGSIRLESTSSQMPVRSLARRFTGLRSHSSGCGLAPELEQSAPHAPGLGIPQPGQNRSDRRRIMYRKLLIGVLVAAIAVTAAQRRIRLRRRRAAPTQLTLWHNYGTEGNAVATNNLVKAFEKLHPDIKIRVVSQPADNYFALLQSSAISQTSPDLATMLTGLFDLKYASSCSTSSPTSRAPRRASSTASATWRRTSTSRTASS